MDDKNAIMMEYVNFKNIKSRQAVEITLECDIMNAEHVFEVLGYPTTHVSKYVAVAPLKGEISEDAKLKKKPFHKMPYSQQVKIMVQDDEFCEYIKRLYGKLPCYDGCEDVEYMIKNEFCIESCSELNNEDNFSPRKGWKDLLSGYLDEKEGRV